MMETSYRAGKNLLKVSKITSVIVSRIHYCGEELFHHSQWEKPVQSQKKTLEHIILADFEQVLLTGILHRIIILVFQFFPSVKKLACSKSEK